MSLTIKNNESETVIVPAIFKGSNGIEIPVNLEVTPFWNDEISKKSDEDPDKVIVVCNAPGANFSVSLDAKQVTDAIEQQAQKEREKLINSIKHA